MAILASIAHKTGNTFDHKQMQASGNAIGLVQMEPATRKYYDEFLVAKKKEDSPHSQVIYVIDRLNRGRHIGSGNAANIGCAFASVDMEIATQEFSK